MEDDQDVDHFPDISHKLAAPKKLSAFERDRQAAEAKARRAEEENAAALREFEESFGGSQTGPDRGYGNISRDPPTGPRGGGFGGRGGRYGAPHMGPRGGQAGSMPKSGPGSLGPAPGGMPPPPSLKRKRMMEEAREAEEARREQAGHGIGESHGRPGSRGSSGTEEDIFRPTVELSSIPPGTTSEEIHALLMPWLKVHSIRLTPPAGPGAAGRKSLAAIATLDSKTTLLQIDTAVSRLRDRYVGCGFFLYISRHNVSSAVPLQSTPRSGALSHSEPFGAQAKRGPKFSMRHAPPPGDQRGIAPPEYYEGRGSVARSGGAQVEVHPPPDLATIRAIHTIVDRIKAEDDPARQRELEALFMNLPETQQDERFAFLYESRSPAGLYYRFCLWGPDSVDEQKRRAKGTERIFRDLDTDWLPPYNELPFPDLSSLAEATEHIDYDSTDEEEDDDPDERAGLNGEAAVQKEYRTRLTPLQRARFTFMLARLPTSIAKLRQGDISRITNYVVNHAGGGSSDFVQLLLLNLERPFSTTSAAKADVSGSEEDDDSAYEPDDALPSMEAKSTPPPATGDSKRDEDPSNAKLIALYVISDILSASSTAGARNAWKYRQLFEIGFKFLKTFERLGRLEKELGWGRMKAEQWKRKMGVVFGVWENGAVFQSEVQDGFKKAFYEPPLTEEELIFKERAEQEVKAAEQELKAKVVEPRAVSKFKKVEITSLSASTSPAPAPVVQTAVEEGVDGVPMDDVDGMPMDDDVDGKPMTDDIDGQPMDDDEATTTAAGKTDSASESKPAAPSRGGFSLRGGKAAAPAPKKRMRAEDMFGDSDEE